MSDFTEDGFREYDLETKETSSIFLGITCTYIGLVALTIFAFSLCYNQTAEKESPIEIEMIKREPEQSIEDQQQQQQQQPEEQPTTIERTNSNHSNKANGYTNQSISSRSSSKASSKKKKVKLTQITLRQFDAMRWKHSLPVGRSTTERSLRLNHSAEDGASSVRSHSRISDLSSGVSRAASQALQNDQSASFESQLHHSYQRSVLPPLSPDAVSPLEAADAHDVGRSLPRTPEGKHYRRQRLLQTLQTDQEFKELFMLSVSPSLTAVADPLFRLVLAAFIGQGISTDSMIAYILVTLILRLTTQEISGALIDAESTLLQQARERGDSTEAGKLQHIAMIAQAVVLTPVLVTWKLFMKDALLWLGATDNMAERGNEYTRIIVADYILQALARALLLIFHVSNEAVFDVTIEAAANVTKIVTLAIVLFTAADSTLQTVAGIQVVITLTAIVLKGMYMFQRGIITPYTGGLFSFAVLDISLVKTFVSTSLPLLIGSLLELREWEFFVLLAQHAGGAEVAIWGLVGIIWEFVESSAEGLADAASIRISYYLYEGSAQRARMVAFKSLFLASVQAALTASVLIVAAPNIATGFTDNITLQNIFVQISGVAGLASVVLLLVQVCWSVVGAQERYGVASFTIIICRWLIAAPIAVISTYALDYDLRSLVLSIGTAHATACSFLVWIIQGSDWEGVANDLQGLEVDDFEESDSDFIID